VAYADHAKKVFEDVFARVGAKEGLPGIRKVLMDNMKNAWKESSTLGNITGDINGALRDAIDMRFIPPGLKEEYPALLALKKSLAWAESQVARDTGGSATAPRQMVKQMLGGAGGGAGIGAIAGGQKFDPKDRSTWLPALGIMGASTLGGAVANRALAAGQRQILGRTAGALRGLVPEGVSHIVSQIAAAAPQIGAKAAQAAGTIPMGQPKDAVEAQTAQAEQTAGPQAVEQARAQVNTVYRDRVMQALQDDWTNIFSAYAGPLGIDFDTFTQMVSGITGGFDDPVKTSRILFHDPTEREKFLADYNQALSFGRMNLESAMTGNQGILGLGGKPGQAQLDYNQLVDYIAGVGGKTPTAAQRKQVEENLNLIAGLNKTPAEKQKLIEDMIQNAGVDLGRLSSLGLYGGKNA